MLQHLNLNKLLFFDIETVSLEKDFHSLSPDLQELWKHKHQFIEKEHEDYSISFPEKAGIYAEFGKVVCISCAYFIDGELKVKSFANQDERIVLESFAAVLNESNYFLCGHNIKEFDVPYLCRRMLVLGISLPAVLDVAGKKPWEVNFVDTLQLWKFGDYKHYTSISLLAAIFDIPTPKDDIDGSQVGNVFWEENDLDRIAEYCQKDVVTVARLIQRWKGDSILSDEDISIIT